MCKKKLMASIGQMKGQYFNAIEMFLNELERHFPIAN
jgi:hypothetical protein